MRIFKKEKPLSYLWAIPIAIILDVVILLAAWALDVRRLHKDDTAGKGRSVPVFLILSLPLTALLFGASVLFSVVMFVVRTGRKREGEA